MVSAIVGVIAGGGRCWVGRRRGVGDGCGSVGHWRLDGNDVRSRRGPCRNGSKGVGIGVVRRLGDNWQRPSVDRLSSNGSPPAGLRTLF